MLFSILFENNLKIIFPELFILIMVSILLIYGVVINTSPTYNYPILTKNIGWLSIQVIFISILLLINNNIYCKTIFYNMLVIDNFTSIIKFIILTATALCIYMSFEYIKAESLNTFEFIILLVLSVLGILFIISSNDLILMYLAIEMQSLCFYVMAALNRNSVFSTEAGLKYFISGALTSGLILFGMSLIYGLSGTTNFEDLTKLFLEIKLIQSNIPHGITIGLSFIIIGLLFKLSAVPFHMWSPDVYEGSPTPVTAFFASVPKLAILSLLVKLLIFIFFEFMESWLHIIILCSVLSLILAAFAALNQTKIKRFLAYSSIGHVGYLLIGLSSGTIEGTQSLLLYTIIYLITTLNIWSFVLATELKTSKGRVKYLTDLKGLSKINIILAINFTIIIFSMAGTPPLAGFCAKLYIFFAAMESSMYGLAIIGVLTSVIGAFYYIRFIKIIFFEKTEKWIFYQTTDREKSLILGITFFFVLFFFLYPAPLFTLTYKAVLSLLF